MLEMSVCTILSIVKAILLRIYPEVELLLEGISFGAHLERKLARTEAWKSEIAMLDDLNRVFMYVAHQSYYKFWGDTNVQKYNDVDAIYNSRSDVLQKLQRLVEKIRDLLMLLAGGLWTHSDVWPMEQIWLILWLVLRSSHFHANNSYCDSDVQS